VRLVSWLKRGVRRAVRAAGYELVRSVPPRRPGPWPGPKADDSRPLPAGAAAELRADHPRLRELRERYARVEGPLARQTMWDADYLRRELDLTRFRGDNAFLWQVRNVRIDPRLAYYLFLRELAARDTRDLLETLSEDGLFGCWTFDYPGWPPVSRDLLDSVGELLFLDRHLGLLERPGLTVLDIGAGYGRLAHRALEAAPTLERYLCVDAIPESTFLCEYYLRFRGCLGRAEVVPLDRFDDAVTGRKIDLAVNVHSFPEMGTDAVAAWVSRLASLEVPWLFIVPNHGDRLVTIESDGANVEFDSVLTEHGYERAIVEPILPDPTLREHAGMTDHFFLFRRQ
jgi:hypothetical protein